VQEILRTQGPTPHPPLDFLHNSSNSGCTDLCLHPTLTPPSGPLCLRTASNAGKYDKEVTGITVFQEDMCKGSVDVPDVLLDFSDPVVYG